jgi:hypothetical protein
MRAPTYQKAKLRELLQAPSLNRLGMTVIGVAKAVHEAQDNEEALVPAEARAQENLGIDARTVVRDAMGLMDLHLGVMCRTGRDATALDQDAKGMMGLGVVVIEEMTEGKVIDRVVGIVENLSVSGPAVEFRIAEILIVIGPAAGVRIEESRIEGNRIVIEEGMSGGTIGGAIQEAGVIGDKNSSVRYGMRTS